MKYRLYTTSALAWDAMLETINGATRSIFLEMYIFLDDTGKNHDFIGTLEKKARQGVQVVIVADAFGSKKLKKETIEEMKKAGIEFIFFSNWLRHIHRKVLIIDERIAFVGGVNIGKRFSNWNDLQLKMRGPVVKSLLRSFAYTYEMAGGKNSKILKLRHRKLSVKLKFWLLEHWPTRNIHTLKNRYVEEINSARELIQITTPYLTPPRWLISLLDDAIRRGVKVEILVPQKVDWRIMNILNYRYMHTLHQLGIEFYLGKTMNHSKLLLIDQEKALVGSQNLDLFSFKLNSEVGIFFKEKKLVTQISQIVKEWKATAQLYQPHHYKLSIADYLVFALLKLLKPIL